MADKYVISASAIIPARRERVYSLIANYLDGHPRILPKQFTSLIVEQGGVGAGTVIRVQMSLLGKKQTFRAAITEPEPGRVLVETLLDGNGAVTTFTVNPGTAPADSHVTIASEIPLGEGIAGKVEKLFRQCCCGRFTSRNWKIWRAWRRDHSAADSFRKLSR